jgi:hypothetical protein
MGINVSIDEIEDIAICPNCGIVIRILPKNIIGCVCDGNRRIKCPVCKEDISSREFNEQKRRD